MQVRPAVLSDLDTLVDYWVDLAAGQKAYDSHLEAEANRTPIRESMAQYITAGGVFVAVADGGERTDSSQASSDVRSDDGPSDILGFVMFGVESGQYEQDVRCGRVHNLFVLPERRGSGIGSELLSAAEKQLWANGVESISLDVLAANEDAHRFYRRHGYDAHRIELEKSTRNDTHSKEDR
ncbi:GNAT family N-acetyltransferase [Haloferax sp. DFSO60]|uniref:GNAT family N-acetyltransferase n=1 Tax=Haloferax sp. DFSO60 TaxID=3388652 RepID=UPI0039792CD2